MKKNSNLDVPIGLRGTRVEETKISSCDIDKRLSYYGYPIEFLASVCEFEEVAYLLQFGKMPTKEELYQYKTKIMAATNLSLDLIEYIKNQPKEANIHHILNIVINYMSIKNPENKDFSNKDDIVIMLLGVIPAVIAFWKNYIVDNKEIAFNTSQESLAGFFLEKINGKKPTMLEIKSFNSLLILYAEHELNASTFTAIVSASAKADYYSAIIAAIGTFYGSIHAGTCEKIISQIEELSKTDINVFVQMKLQKKEKIYGFGHGAYNDVDPRMPIMKQLANKLSNGDILFNKINELENIMHERRSDLPANIDLYSPLVMTYLNIKEEYYTAILVMSRICGWSAHITEKRCEGTLIRPRAFYNGILLQPKELILDKIQNAYNAGKISREEFLNINELMLDRLKNR